MAVGNEHRLAGISNSASPSRNVQSMKPRKKWDCPS
jgi:hypothetical protein